MRHDRVVLAYHGCDAAVADRLLAGEPFRASANDYDWLGSGVYFWEYGADRALQFARDQQRRGKLAEPAVVRAVIQLGRCFDLMDTYFTRELASAYREYRSILAHAGAMLPRNAGSTPDKKLRRLDCSGRAGVSEERDLSADSCPAGGAKPGLHRGRFSSHSADMVEDDAFWEYDDLGNPLDPETRERRAALRRMFEEHSRMTPAEAMAFSSSWELTTPTGR